MATTKKPTQPKQPAPQPVPDRKGHSTVGAHLGAFTATGNWSVGHGETRIKIKSQPLFATSEATSA